MGSKAKKTYNCIDCKFSGRKTTGLNLVYCKYKKFQEAIYISVERNSKKCSLFEKDEILGLRRK